MKAQTVLCLREEHSRVSVCLCFLLLSLLYYLYFLHSQLFFSASCSLDIFSEVNCIGWICLEYAAGVKTEFLLLLLCEGVGGSSRRGRKERGMSVRWKEGDEELVFLKHSCGEPGGGVWGGSFPLCVCTLPHPCVLRLPDGEELLAVNGSAVHRFKENPPLKCFNSVKRYFIYLLLKPTSKYAVQLLC